MYFAAVSLPEVQPGDLTFTGRCGNMIGEENCMTSLAKRKTRLLVEFSDCVRERGKLREVTMELTPYGLSVRLKGMRSSFEISPAAVYNRAVLLAVEKARSEKKAKKGAK